VMCNPHSGLLTPKPGWVVFQLSGVGSCRVSLSGRRITASDSWPLGGGWLCTEGYAAHHDFVGGTEPIPVSSRGAGWDGQMNRTPRDLPRVALAREPRSDEGTSYDIGPGCGFQALGPAPRAIALYPTPIPYSAELYRARVMALVYRPLCQGPRAGQGHCTANFF
jgi:hypothetical protein